jgi:hypothetical protein
MKLRADNSEIVLIERQLADSPDPPKKLGKMEKDKPKQFTLYVTIADHGIAMAEYVYKLRKGDPGWEDTVESWISNYRTFLRREKLDCGDYDPDFVRFIENRALRVNREKFCREEWEGNIDFLPLGIAAAFIMVVVLAVFVNRRVWAFWPPFRREL